MNPRRHDRSRALQALTLGAVGLLLTSCAAFHPQRIQVAARVTQTLPPSAVVPVMGVGSAKRFNAIKWSVVKRMVWAWVLTIPVTGLIAYILVRLFGFFGWRQ